MATIVTRQTGATAVSRPLTNTELDNNFINLNTAVTAATTGPASATDNALVRFNATTGKLVQNSSVIVDDLGKLTATSIIAGESYVFPDASVQTTAAINVDGVSNLTDTVASWSIMSTFAGVANPTDIFFKADGTKMFLLVAGTLNQYTLTYPWDITTAGSLVSINTTWDTASLGLFFSPDGTKLITCGQTAVVNAGLGIAASEDRAYYLTLSTPWDISTTTLVSSLRFAAGIAGLPVGETGPAGITFNDTGTIMYMVGSGSDAIYQYTLTTAYNVSTATYSKQLSMSSIESGLTGIRFNNIGSSSIAGSRMYIIGTTNDSITEFRLNTPWDIATAVYYDELYVGNYDGLPNGLYIDEIDYNAYIVGTTSDLVTRFGTSFLGISLAPGLTTGKIDLIGETRVKNANLYVDKNVNIDGDITLAGTLTAVTGFAGIVSGNYAITLNSTTTAINIGTPQTTGTIIIGGTAGTGAITLGQSTAAQTLNLGTGANTNGITKAINIGTNGLTSSMTNIVIGSAVGGTDTTLNVAGRLAVVQSTGGYNNVSNLAGGTTVTGSGTLFTKTFQVGDTITIGGQTVAISAIASDTSMTTAAITNANTNATYTLTGGTRFVVNGNGNVGIGTALPSAKLDVRAEVTNGYTPSIRISRSSATLNDQFLAFNNGLVTDAQIGRLKNSDDLLFGFNGGTGFSEKMRLEDSGNLGIGTTSPLATMHASAPLSAGTIVNVGMFGQNSGSNPTVGQGARITLSATNNAGRCAAIQGVHESGTNAHYMAFLTSANGLEPAERMRIDSAGNVGIGTTSITDFSGQVLAVHAASGSAARIKLTTATSGTTSGDGGGIVYDTSNILHLINRESDGVISFATQAIERMRLDSSGNLGIGTVPIIGYGTSIQLKNTGGATSALLAQSISVTDQIVSLSNNALPPAGGYTGTYNYTTSSTASLYELRNNTHTWLVAPSGTAGATTTVTSGQVYIVTVLSTSTLAQWQALFSSLVALPTVGASLVATATGTLAGGATVTQRISFNSAMKLDGTGNLLVGAFTTSIAKKLTVVGEGNFTDGSANTRLYMGFGTVPATGGTGAYVFNADNSPLVFGTTNLERVRIDASGNLLLGTTAVTSKLTIYTGNTSNANEGISLTRGPGPDNVFGMRLKSDGTGQYRNAITSKSSVDAEIEVITIDPVSGNVGINTISPNYKLDVSGNVRVANTLTVNGNLITRNLSIFARSFMTMGA